MTTPEALSEVVPRFIDLVRSIDEPNAPAVGTWSIALVAANADDQPVSWLGGVRMAPSAVTCHLLEECLMHGYGIARAAGRRWPINRDHAVFDRNGWRSSTSATTTRNRTNAIIAQ